MSSLIFVITCPTQWPRGLGADTERGRRSQDHLNRQILLSALSALALAALACPGLNRAAWWDKWRGIINLSRQKILHYIETIWNSKIKMLLMILGWRQYIFLPILSLLQVTLKRAQTWKKTKNHKNLSKMGCFLQHHYFFTFIYLNTMSRIILAIL